MDRRTFVGSTLSCLALHEFASAQARPNWRVAVIGHTGRGNYGHGLDTVWQRVPGATVVAVADADPSGLAAAKKRLAVDDAYADYREMLRTVKPELVAVCPRHPDQHRNMVLAAIDSGARGIYVEKPFCRMPAEADEIISACEQQGTKLAVAHRNRYHPTLQSIGNLIRQGVVGKLLEMRGRGKGDRRGGGEDLWVLGSHVMNLMHYFGGAPQTCSAVILQNGKRVTKADVKEGNEALGPLAGDEVHARYTLQGGVIGYFDSIANDETEGQGFGLQLVGSAGIVNIQVDLHPLAHFVPGNPFQPGPKPRPWLPITSAGLDAPEPLADLPETIGKHIGPARDLIEAIETDRQPRCNVYEGAMTVEMICAVFASHRREGQMVEFPLDFRGNALTKLT